jgi:hypothetical protein
VAAWIARLDRPGILVLLGRQSLAVFCAGSVLAVGAQVARFVLEAGVALEAALVLGGIALQVGLAMLLAWMEGAGRKGRPAAVPVAPGGRAALGEGGGG